MNRPVYESENDRINEHDVAVLLAGLWKMTAHKNPSFYELDYSFSRDLKICSIAEIKVRTNTREAYPDYMISAGKVGKAMLLHQATGVPCLLIVRWSCGAIGLINLTTEPDNVRWGGRNDRGDGQDMEPCVFWNIDRFHVVKQPAKENER